MNSTVSAKLFAALKRGRKQLSKEALCRVTEFVASQQTKEGAFVGKSGQSDLYYTMFGWTLSYALGMKMDDRKMNEYLDKQDANSLDFIHFAAYARCKFIAILIDSIKKAGLIFKILIKGKMNMVVDFAGEPDSEKKSPYMQYIALSMIEDARKNVPDEKDMLDSIAQYRLPDGGYKNIQSGLTATTNATVAALAVRGQLEGYATNDDVRFLRGLQDASGGFRAAEGSPVPDLLSTATALFMLNCYGVEPLYPVRDFIEAHWLDSGGFAATLLDDQSDVEYTFYGLLALGSIH